jgi:hypothetical protein
MNDKQDLILKDVRKTYLLAKAVSIMYEAIKHDVSPEIRKAALEAKAKNNFFIKLIDESFRRRNVSENFINLEEDLSFDILDKMYEEAIKK